MVGSAPDLLYTRKRLYAHQLRPSAVRAEVAQTLHIRAKLFFLFILYEASGGRSEAQYVRLV